MTNRTEESRKVSRVLGELAGAASMCWEPRPTGVFDASLAAKFVADAERELAAPPIREAAAPPDADCVCRGNWRLIVRETQGLLDRRFRNHRGHIFTFYGIVHGSDDYYYGMASERRDVPWALLSCVGSIEGHGYELLAEDAAPAAEPVAPDDLIARLERDAKAWEMVPGTHSGTNTAALMYEAAAALSAAREDARLWRERFDGAHATITLDNTLLSESYARRDAAEADLARARLMLADVFALMDEGYLVRNISEDSKPGWAMKQLPFLMRLKAAQAFLAEGDKGAKG